MDITTNQSRQPQRAKESHVIEKETIERGVLMNNVIPIRRDPLRNLYELIDKLNDTELTISQQSITDEALALVQKMIEDSHANRADKIGRGDFHPSA